MHACRHAIICSTWGSIMEGGLVVIPVCSDCQIPDYKWGIPLASLDIHPSFFSFSPLECIQEKVDQCLWQTPAYLGNCPHMVLACTTHIASDIGAKQCEDLWGKLFHSKKYKFSEKSDPTYHQSYVAKKMMMSIIIWFWCIPNKDHQILIIIRILSVFSSLFELQYGFP